MALEGMSAVLNECILNIFRGHEVALNNQHLMQFTETAESWNPILDLIQSPLPHVGFFSMNLLLNKVKRNWKQLSDAEKLHLHSQLGHMVAHMSFSSQRDATSQAYVDRLVLALIAVSIRIPEGLDAYLRRALDCGAGGDATGACLGLSMLLRVPEEVEAADVSRELRGELNDTVLRHSARVFESFDRAACLLPPSPVVAAQVLRTCRAWLSQGLGLSELFCGHRALFDLACSGLLSANKALLSEGLALLQDVVAVAEFPRTAARDEAVLTLIGLFAAHGSSILSHAAADGEAEDRDLGSQLVNALAALAAEELPLVLRSGAGLLRVLLASVGRRPRALLEITFDLWQDLQDVASAERGPVVVDEVVPALLRLVLGHCLLPARRPAGGGSEDDEDLEAFRDVRLGLPDLLSFCLFAARDLFFAQLQMHVAAASSGPDAWPHLEVVLFALSCVGDSLKRVLESRDANFSCDQVAAWLFGLVREVVSLDGAAPPQLLDAASKFLGSLTFLLAKSPGSSALDPPPFSGLFAPALEMLMRVVGRPQLASAELAASAFHKLSINGVKLLQGVDCAQLGVLCRAHADLLQSAAVPIQAQLKVTEALVRCVMAATPAHGELQVQLMGALTAPLAQALRGAQDLSRMVDLLRAADQLVRFADAPCESGTHVLDGFLSAMWPSLLALSGGEPSRGGDRVQAAVFEVFGRVLHSLGRGALPVVDSIAHAVLHALRSSSGACTAALRCGSALVEFSAAQMKATPGEAGHVLAFLQTFLRDTVLLAGHCAGQSDTADGRAAVQRAFFGDLDCVTEFFDLLYRAVVLTPAALAHPTGSVDRAMGLAVLCLAVCSEREQLRSVMMFAQHCFCPPSFNGDAAAQGAIFGESCRYGQQVMALLLLAVSENRLVSTLVGNVADTLLAVLSGCRNSQEISAQVPQWVRRSVVEQPGAFAQLAESRELLALLVLELSVVNARRFRALIQDLFKVCGGELTADTLLAYADVLDKR